MLANSAGTLPPGHFLIEPYFYDIHTAHADNYGSRSYVLYGLIDKLTIGFIPIESFNTAESIPSSSGIGLGDLTLIAQYRVHKFHEKSRLPAMAIQVQQSFPTARYDRLSDRPTNGFGSGVYSTLVGFNTQKLFWMPNGRILRMRLNVSDTYSQGATLTDVSVYGTQQGFRGSVKPANSESADAAWEYSLTRRWVLALDLTYGHGSNTRVSGVNVDATSAMGGPTSVLLNSGTNDSFAIAPAIEYNVRSYLGFLLGTRLIPSSHGTTPSVTPALAINFVH